MITTLAPLLKDETRFSYRCNGPLQPKADQPLAEPFPNRTQPFPLSFTSPARQVGVCWIINRRVSVLNLQGFISLRPSDFKCAGIRIGPRRSPPPRQQIPKGARLKAADAGTRRLRALRLAQGGTSSEPQSNSEQSRTTGPGLGSKHPKGLVGAVLKAEVYRLQPEGLPPEEMQDDLRGLY